MAFPTFTPPKEPSIDHSVETSLRLKSIKFGDGYSQTSLDGLNAEEHTTQLKWPTLTLTEANTIHTFFSSAAGGPFYYMIPVDGVVRKWRCAKWSRSPSSGSLIELSATFEEAFDLDDI